MKQITSILVLLYTIVVFIGCKGNGTPEKVEEEKETVSKEEHKNENIVTFTEEQMKTIGIETGRIEQKELTNAIKATGVLTVPNQNKAFVTPLHSGVVKLLNIQPGSYVAKGKVIAIIENPALIQWQQQLQQVNAQIALAELEVKRQQELVAGNATPLKKLQQVQTDLLTLKSVRTGLKKQLLAVGASQQYSFSVAVKAPISGTVSKVMAQLGSNVDVTAPIAEIVNNSQLHLDVYVYEKDLEKLKAQQIIHFTITNNAGKEYDAEIFSIGTAFEANTKTIPVHAKVIGDKTNLIDGMNVTALVSLNKSKVPAVPTEAIVNLQGKDFVFMILPGKQKGATVFEKIPVVKGTSDVGFTEITLLNDIPSDAKIVLKGAFFVLAKLTNTDEGG